MILPHAAARRDLRDRLPAWDFAVSTAQGVSLHWRMVVPDLGLLHECLAMTGLPPHLLDHVWPRVSTIEVGREDPQALYVVCRTAPIGPAAWSPAQRIAATAGADTSPA